MPSRDEDGNLLNALSSKERTDIKLAIKILFDHVPLDSRREYPLDRLDLRDLDLSEFDLQNVDMFNANLEGTFLISANLEGALFYKANLRNAYLWGAELKKADLSNAELQGGAFASSKLQDTNFQNSKLQGAFFNGVRLQGTNLQNAELQNVDLSYADLQGVKNMKQEQLNECVYSKNHQPKNLPAGLKLPSSRAFEYTEEKINMEPLAAVSLKVGKCCHSFLTHTFFSVSKSTLNPVSSHASHEVFDEVAVVVVHVAVVFHHFAHLPVEDG